MPAPCAAPTRCALSQAWHGLRSGETQQASRSHGGGRAGQLDKSAKTAAEVIANHRRLSAVPAPRLELRGRGIPAAMPLAASPDSLDLLEARHSPRFVDDAAAAEDEMAPASRSGAGGGAEAAAAGGIVRLPWDSAAAGSHSAGGALVAADDGGGVVAAASGACILTRGGGLPSLLSQLQSRPDVWTRRSAWRSMARVLVRSMATRGPQEGTNEPSVSADEADAWCRCRLHRYRVARP